METKLQGGIDKKKADKKEKYKRLVNKSHIDTIR